MSEQRKQPLSIVLNNGTKMPILGLGTLMYTLKVGFCSSYNYLAML